MKANEFRITNKVLWNNEIVPVDEISSTGIFILPENSCDGWHAVEYSDIQPIPLTEEWLIKFGFIKKEPATKETDIIISYSKNDIRIDIIAEKSFIFFHYPRTIQLNSVHQLQNLWMAICGEELEINL